MSDLAELTGFAQRYAEAWCSLVTSLISSYELWKIDNGAGGSRTTWTGKPREGWRAGRRVNQLLRRAEAAQPLQSGGGFLTARSNQHPVFPFFEIPNWAVRLVVLLLIIGFPVAMILAWAFELTPEGLMRTEVADELPKKSGRSSA